MMAVKTQVDVLAIHAHFYSFFPGFWPSAFRQTSGFRSGGGFGQIFAMFLPIQASQTLWGLHSGSFSGSPARRGK